MTETAHTETLCSELAQETPRKRGPKKDPNALQFRSVGLSPFGWSVVEKWRSENDAPGNMTPALGRAVEALDAFQPAGPAATRERGGDGRFVGRRGPAPKRPTRTQLEAELRRLRARVEELEAKGGAG